MRVHAWPPCATARTRTKDAPPSAAGIERQAGVSGAYAYEHHQSRLENADAFPRRTEIAVNKMQAPLSTTVHAIPRFGRIRTRVFSEETPLFFRREEIRQERSKLVECPLRSNVEELTESIRWIGL